MLLTHCFGSQEKLDRARYWLTWHGFHVQESPRAGADAKLESRPRLTIRVALARSAAAHALIDSIEHDDPDAWPDLIAAPARRWVVDQPLADGVAGASTPHGTPIHWEARREEGADASASRVAEYMFSRWE